MELKWLDDYMALVETGTFSAAAERRHVSQPAFSRRIQALEEWLGVELIDRARKPLRFTPVAAGNEAAFRSLVARIYEFRAQLKSDSLDSAGITIATQHTLAAAYLPEFLAQLHHFRPEQTFRILSENRADSVDMLMRGQAQILLVYEAGSSAVLVPPQMATRHRLGQDELVPVAVPALCDTLAAAEPGAAIPMLCYPPDSFFGQAVRVAALAELMRRRPVVVRCVSAFAFSLREMALVGQGAAWLPRALVAQDLAQGRLRALPELGPSVPLGIVVYFGRLAGEAVDRLAAQFDRQR